MVSRNAENAPLSEFLEQELNNADVPAPENFSLVRRPETGLITGVEASHHSWPLPTRRQFMLTASAATAVILIKPLNVGAAQNRFWTSLKTFFTGFGTNLLFTLLGGNMLPGQVPGFRGLASIFLSQLPQLLFGGGCFGNVLPAATPSVGLLNRREGFNSLSRRRMLSSYAEPRALPPPPTQPTKVLALLGNSNRFNAGVAYLNQEKQNDRVVKPGQVFIGIKDVSPKVFSNRDNLPAPGPGETEKTVKNKYFMPRWDGDFGRYARETMRDLVPFTESFSPTATLPVGAPRMKPRFFESEVESLVLITYEADVTRRDGNGRPKEGEGESIVYTVPPGERKQNVTRWIGRNQNFWDNNDVLKQFISVMKNNIASGSDNESSTYGFKAAD